MQRFMISSKEKEMIEFPTNLPEVVEEEIEVTGVEIDLIEVTDAKEVIGVIEEKVEIDSRELLIEAKAATEVTEKNVPEERTDLAAVIDSKEKEVMIELTDLAEAAEPRIEKKETVVMVREGVAALEVEHLLRRKVKQECF